MNKSFCTLTAALALALPVAMQAQALPAAVGPGSQIVLGGGFSWYQQDYGKRQIGGGWTYLDLHPTWRYAIEGEARTLRLNTAEQVTESTWLVGLKVNLRSRPARVEPYAKLLVGAGRINLPFNYAHGTFFTYAPGAGVEYALNDRVKLRVLDVEVQRWTKFPFGNLQPYGISTGISFRLNGYERYPRGGAR